MKTNSGFTLIEVLVTMLIMAIGLLGLAGIQVTGMRNNLSAYNRSQATQLAYDMADRMRANVANAGTFGASVYTTIDPISDAVAQASCIAVAGACTAAQMAQQDLFEWNQNLAALPGGEGTIIVAPSNLFTITVNWDDNRDGDTNLITDPNFQMIFQL